MGILTYLGSFVRGSKEKSRAERFKDYTKKVIDAERIEESSQYIGDLIRGLKKDQPIAETFENAYQRLGMTEETLEKTYKFYTSRYYVFLFFLTIGLVFAAYFLFQSKWMSGIAVLAFCLICLTQVFAASFRAMQIRHRELFGVQVWLKNPSEWAISDFVRMEKASYQKLSGPSATSRRNNFQVFDGKKK